MAPDPRKACHRAPQGLNDNSLHSDVIDVPLARRPSSSGAVRKYLLPSALCALACLLAATLMVARTSRTSVFLRASPDVSRQSAMATSSDAVSQTTVLQLLKDIKADQKHVFAALSERLRSSIHAANPTSKLSNRTAAGSNTSPNGATAAADVPAALALVPLLTNLHNKILRQSTDFELHRSLMQKIFSELVHMPAAAAQAEVQQELNKGTLGPLEVFVYELYKLILSSGKLIPCREDTTLRVGDTLSLHQSSNRSSSPSKSNSNTSSSSTGMPWYFFATNLRDNSVQMPHYTLSLLQTLLRLPQDSVFVSVYESNSDDGVQGWIDILELALNIIGTHNRVVTRGMLIRSENQDRIEFLARVRNMALAPLYSYYSELELKGAGSRTDHTNSGSTDNSSTGSSGSSMGPGVLPWEPDYVVFINDVYFCWGMVLRLMNYRADITCGTDWGQHWGNTDSLPPKSPKRNKALRSKPQIPPELKLETPIPEPMSPDQKNPISFYDIWVARDVSGGKFWWWYPYIMDKESSVVMKQGLPVRASCCWNGLAVLRAEPFKRGVRFRMHQEGECRASECTLMCNDFARLGYKEVVVDTGVQLAYDWNLAREIMAVGIEGVGLSSWAEVKAAGISQAHRQPDYQNMECCFQRPGENFVQFSSDCYREDIMQRNYTRSASQRGKTTTWR